MSPAIYEAATVAAMQKSLQAVRDLNSNEQRVYAYIRAGFSNRDILRFDSEAVRTEQIRRRLLAGADKAEQSA